MGTTGIETWGEAGDPVGGARPLRRRHALPGGRAVAGGFLVAAAAVGLFASYLHATRRPLAHYVVARRAVSTGQTLTDGDLALAAVDLPAAMAGHAFRHPAEVIGRVALAPVAAGELLQDGGLTGHDAGLGGRQVAVPVDAAQLDGLQPGGWVDILVTSGQGSDSHTDVVASGARLLGVVRPHTALGVGSNPVVQLDVADLETVKAIIQAAHDGALTLVPAPNGNG